MRCITISIVTLICLVGYSQEKNEAAIKYAETILAEDLKEHLEIIASDEYEGRETGKKGQRMCADYMANYFESIGIPPCIDTSYFQYYPLEVKKLTGTITISETDYEFLEDFYFFPGTPLNKFEITKALFLGFGINDEEYSDYEDQEVAGKTILVLDGEPFDKKDKSYVSGSSFASKWTTNWRQKTAAAKEADVEVMLVVVPEIETQIEQFRHYLETPSMNLVSNGEEEGSTGTAIIYISEEIANALLTDLTVETAREQIEKKGKPYSDVIENGFVVDLENSGSEVIASNVLGYIEGTDLKDEVIVITAHYDHIGIDEGEVYNGADDDGSGTVALLEIAEAFQAAKDEGEGPRRSILIMGFSGEEKGLLGSEYYADNPVFSLENTVCDLNIDMIGRVDEAHEGNANYVYLIGSDKLSTELHDVSEWANETYMNIELDYTFNDPNDPNRFYYRSDHYNFAKYEVPVIFYFNGVHEDYHKATDTVEKIDYDKIEKITQLVFHTAWELANQDNRIEVNVENDFD